MLCTRRSHSFSGCPGGGKLGKVSGEVTHEKRKAERVKPNLKPRQLPGMCELPASSSWEALPQSPGTGLLGKQVPEPEQGPHRDSRRGDGGSGLVLLHPGAVTPQDSPFEQWEAAVGGLGVAGWCRSAPHLQLLLWRGPRTTLCFPRGGFAWWLSSREGVLCLPWQCSPVLVGTAFCASSCVRGHPMFQGILG